MPEFFCLVAIFEEQKKTKVIGEKKCYLHIYNLTSPNYAIKRNTDWMQ